MKKLLFALAGAAAFAAMADNASARPGVDHYVVGFEDYAVNTTNIVGFADDGTSGGGTYWSTTGEDNSYIRAYAGKANAVDDSKDAPNGVSFPAPFESAGDQYLALDTNGSELKRKMNTDDSALTVAADGTYIDTLVQFTPSESAPTDLDSDVKLAIWLSSENGVTNLMVRGAFYTMTDGTDPTSFAYATPTNYVLSGTYEPNAWYRLTVKNVQTLMNGMPGQYLPGFVISVNGQTLTATTAAADATAYTFLTSQMGEGEEAFTPVSGDNKDLLDNRQFIPSLGVANMGTAPTLSSVGFKGTGALDDFVVTTADPFAGPAVIDFTLTLSLGANVDSCTVTTNGATVAFVNGEAQIPSNTVVTIAAPTFASGYELDAFTWGGVSIAPATFPTNFTLEANTTVAFTAKQTPGGWADDPEIITPGATAATVYAALAGSALATADAKELTVWAKAKNVEFSAVTSAPDDYVEAFLLNCAPTAEAVAEEKEEFVLTITFDGSGNPVVSTPDGKTYNGQLQMKGSTDLSTWSNTDTTEGYQFFKFELSL